MQFSLLLYLLAMLAVISATDLSIDVSEDSLSLATRDEDAIPHHFGPQDSYANFSLLFESDAPTYPCDSVTTTVVFNQVPDYTELSRPCAYFSSYMTSIPGSYLKTNVTGVSFVYICPREKKQQQPEPTPLGVANINLVIHGGPKVWPISPPFPPVPMDIQLTVINAVYDPITNFTLPALMEWGFVTQSDGSTKTMPTAIHCN